MFAIFIIIRNFKIDRRINDKDDSGLKSSKPETSVDTLYKNRNTEQDNNDLAININKDSFDDECKIFNIINTLGKRPIIFIFHYL